MTTPARAPSPPSTASLVPRGPDTAAHATVPEAGRSVVIASDLGAHRTAEPTPGGRGYLLVADHRLPADLVVHHVRDLVGDDPAGCHVVVPATPTDTRPWTWDEDEARRVAADRMVQILAGLRRVGVEATGEVGDPDLTSAVDDARRGRRGRHLDEVLLALPPGPIARGRGSRARRRIRRSCDVPVSHLVISLLGRDGRPRRDGIAVGSMLRRAEERLVLLAQRHSVGMLRAALGIVFLWFGVLKLAGVSPVGEVVTRTLFVLPMRPAMILLGVVETAIGISLITGRALRAALAVLLVQMCGTFLVLVLAPDLSFQHGNPLLLSTVGEFVIKNLVLISAGVALVGALRRRPTD
jgi:putative oxidoreductase